MLLYFLVLWVLRVALCAYEIMREPLMGCLWGVPLPSLYTREAGLHGRVLVGLQGRSPSWLQLYLLYVRKVGFYPYSGRSFMMSCVASSPGASVGVCYG